MLQINRIRGKFGATRKEDCGIKWRNFTMRSKCDGGGCWDFCGTGDRQKRSSLMRHDAFGLRDSVTSSIGNSRREKWQEDPEERRRRKPS